MVLSPSKASTAQVTETQGSSSKLHVEVTVLRAHNIPHIKRWLGMKRRFFVTVTCQETTIKTASVKIDGETVSWNQKLDPFFVQPSSRLKLRLHAKRFLRHDILVGTHEIPLPPGSTSDLSFDLSKGNNRQAEQSMQPVTVHLKVTMSGNATSPPSLPIDTTNPIPGADSLPTENAADPYKAPGITHDTPETEAVADSTESLSYPTGHVPVETNAPTSPSPPAGARAEAPLTRKAHDPDKVTKTSETAEGSGAHQPDPSTSTTTERESTIDDILKAAKRFRILLVGRSGVGKSSLINCVFGIEAAHVEDQKPGKANIRQELVSPENQYFVLHDSQGFEPGDLSNFETVRNFVQERSREELPLSEKIHGLWLCTETPTAGGRVFETGDEKLLQFAHEKKVPIVVVFTKYDKLVRTKEGDLLDEHPDMDHTRMHDRGVEEARKTFDECLKSFQDTVGRLGIPMPRYATVSVRPGHAGDVLSLVQVTRDTVKDRVEGDAWVLWAIAQRQSLPVKINACVTKGISYYRRTLIDSQRAAPESGPILLRDCIGEVHKDIMTCWNFKGEVLNSPEFRQLMLCLVQDVHTDPNVSTLPNVDIISQFVELVTAVPAPIAPPGTILGLSYMFVKWLSTTSLESIPSVQRFLIAYAVGLVGVLRNLFDVTLGLDLALKPDSVLTPTWKELREAFEFYENFSRQRIHGSIHSNLMRGRRMTVEDTSEMFRELLLSLL